jgi:hypothetical protein
MKKIFLFLCCFVLGVFILDRTISTLFEKFIFNKTYSGESGGNLNYLFQKKNNISFLVAGSSRAKNMINPDSLSALSGEGYNAGVNGVGGVLYMNVLADLLLNKKIKPKYFILQTDVRDFSINRANGNRAEITRLYPFIDDSKILQQYSKQLGFEETLKLNLNLYKFNGKFYNIIINRFKNNNSNNSNGFNALTGAMSLMNEHETIDNLEQFDSLKIDALNNIIKVCDDNKIILFIVFPPRYKNVMPEQTQLTRLLSRLKINPDSYVIDMIDINKFPDLKDKINWKDEAHLNVLGANKFTVYLNDSIQSKLKLFIENVNPIANQNNKH